MRAGHGGLLARRPRQGDLQPGRKFDVTSPGSMRLSPPGRSRQKVRCPESHMDLAKEVPDSGGGLPRQFLASAPPPYSIRRV